MDAYSVRAKIKKDQVKADGTSLIYLQVIINRKQKKLGLDLYWPADKFDNEGGECLKRNKADKDCNDYNMIIRSAIGKCNNIFKEARLSDQHLTLESFYKSYRNDLSRVCFINYMEQKIEQRFKNKDIGKITRDNHTTALNSLKRFRKEIPFNTLDHKFCEELDSFLKKQKNQKRTKKTPTPISANTLWSRHKDIKTYILAAIKDEIKFANPYEHFTAKRVAGKWVSITSDEVKKLDGYYKTLRPGTPDRQILQQFLFGCTTGLRWSDQVRVLPEWVHGDLLVFLPYKSRNKEKLLSLPLTRRALELLEDGQRENASRTVFKKFSVKFYRENLTRIGIEAGVRSRLHPHAARETFATLYLENGGKLEVLKELLGHRNIETTMKYVHVSHQRKKDELVNMNKIFD